MLVASSCSTLGVSDMPYILPQRPLRVSQKAKSHLEIINEPLLVTALPPVMNVATGPAGSKGQPSLHLARLHCCGG